MMLEFSFWKTSPPQTTNGIYELRKYNLKVSAKFPSCIKILSELCFAYLSAWKSARMGILLVKYNLFLSLSLSL